MDVGFGLAVRGLDEAIEHLQTVGDAVQALAGRKDTIRSDLPYAYGQNYGRYRTGRLARRSGPTFYFEAGVQEIERSAADQLGPAIWKGPAAVRSAWSTLLKRGVKTAQSRAPRKSGDLRDSIHSSDGFGR